MVRVKYKKNFQSYKNTFDNIKEPIIINENLSLESFLIIISDVQN